MTRQVTYTIIVDAEMFPFAPGSEVVCRDYSTDKWGKYLFAYADTNFKSTGGKAYVVVGRIFTYCHPLATHGHLLGTTYPADTPACAKCGKAVAIMPQGYDVCLCRDCQEQPTATTGEFHPFQRVLVRNASNEAWDIDYFSRPDGACGFICTSSVSWLECVPHDGNEHLLGTTDAPEPIAPRDASDAKPEMLHVPIAWYNELLQVYVRVDESRDAYASKNRLNWRRVARIPASELASCERAVGFVNGFLLRAGLK